MLLCSNADAIVYDNLVTGAVRVFSYRTKLGLLQIPYTGESDLLFNQSSSTLMNLHSVEDMVAVGYHQAGVQC